MSLDHRVDNLDGLDERLRRLGPGLDREILASAVEHADVIASHTSPLAPPGFEGTTLHAETFAALARFLIEHGWRRVERQGFCTVVSPDGATQIAVATGNGRTGADSADGEPRTKNPRGARTGDAIARNVQPNLFESVPPPAVPRSTTYFLLIARRRREIRMELSCPVGQDELGRISRWSDRIVLDPIGGEKTIPLLDSAEEGASEAVDFEVRRRSA